MSFLLHTVGDNMVAPIFSMLLSCQLIKKKKNQEWKCCVYGKNALWEVNKNESQGGLALLDLLWGI